MRLPKLNQVDSAPKSVTTSNRQKAKRGVIEGDSCNPYELKSTPYAFETMNELGLAFGEDTFYIAGAMVPSDIDVSNLPNMTAVRQAIDFSPADAGQGEYCVPANFTFPDNQLTPQYVLAPGQQLKTYMTPDRGYRGDLVWKMTPFHVDTPDGGFIANGTDNVVAPNSGLTMDQFPIQLALRPLVEFQPADAGVEWATALSVLAPTNVATILPVRTAYDETIASYLAPLTTAAVATSTAVGTSASATITAGPTAQPAATSIASVPTNARAHTSPAVVAGAVLGSVIGLALVGGLGYVAYKKVKSMREDATMGTRIKAWAATRGIELTNLPAANPGTDA